MASHKFDGQPNSGLYLDPGTPRRPKRSISGCKCILLTITVVVLSGIGLFLFFLLEQLVGEITQPHNSMYEKGVLDAVNRLTAVQPLISHESIFDIAATVWVRKTEGVGHGDKFATEGRAQIESLSKNLDVLAEEADDPDSELETPIFSDIVFRGLRLADKYVFSTVNFTLPTAVFRAANLSNLDLRGSFVLIPSSPSPFSSITNYSSWYPDEIKPLPTRSWPFPLNSKQAEKSLADKAIESFGVSVPLLSFQGVHSRCSGGSDDMIPLVDEDEEVTNQPPLGDLRKSPTLETTNGKSLLESHPYVVTRTQIHVVDQTQLFNRRAYMKAHRALKATACGKTIFGNRPSRYLCEIKYKSHGHWMTQMQLGLEQPNGKIQTKWAYSPYMAATHVSAGPKDFLMIPVNREYCKNTEDGDVMPSSKIPPEQDFINVSWRLSYSGRSPIKHMLSAFTGNPIIQDFNQSEYHKTLGQDSADLWLGLVGHRFNEDAHPRRRAFLMVIGVVFATVIVLLDIRYWYTRKSTIGISILGTALIAGSDVFVQVASTIAQGRLDRHSVAGWIALFLFTLFTSLVPPLLMFKAIARIEFGWWKETTWIPVLQKSQATHKERTSERMETKVTWPTRIGVLMSFVALYLAIAPHKKLIIPSILPAPGPDDFAPDRLADLSPYFIYPLHTTGKVLQLTLNHHSKSFAGSYKLAAALSLVLNLSTLASFVPSIVGRYDARPGLSLKDVIDVILLSINAWQALTLPSVIHAEVDDRTD